MATCRTYANFDTQDHVSNHDYTIFNFQNMLQNFLIETPEYTVKPEPFTYRFNLKVCDNALCVKAIISFRRDMKNHRFSISAEAIGYPSRNTKKNFSERYREKYARDKFSCGHGNIRFISSHLRNHDLNQDFHRFDFLNSSSSDSELEEDELFHDSQVLNEENQRTQTKTVRIQLRSTSSIDRLKIRIKCVYKVVIEDPIFIPSSVMKVEQSVKPFDTQVQEVLRAIVQASPYDFLVNIGSQSFEVHRSMLSSNSKFFETLFHSNFTDSQRSDITLEDTDPIAFQLVIDYLYTQALKTELLNERNLVQTLILADRFMIDKLKGYCILKLVNYFINKDNMYFFLELNETLPGCEAFYYKTCDIIHHNPGLVKGDQFKEFEKRFPTMALKLLHSFF